jgi:hypothetical protein
MNLPDSQLFHARDNATFVRPRPPSPSTGQPQTRRATRVAAVPSNVPSSSVVTANAM